MWILLCISGVWLWDEILPSLNFKHFPSCIFYPVIFNLAMQAIVVNGFDWSGRGSWSWESEAQETGESNWLLCWRRWKALGSWVHAKWHFVQTSLSLYFSFIFTFNFVSSHLKLFINYSTFSLSCHSPCWLTVFRSGSESLLSFLERQGCLS